MRVSLPILLALLAVSLRAGPQDGAGIPAALEDAEFWRLTVELSEADGFFEDENYVSNEVGHQSVLPELIGTVGPGGVYVGVGPEQNFSYVAALEPRIAFVVDIRRQNMAEHLVYKALFELSDNRADFVSRLFSRPRPAGLDEGSTVGEIFTAYESVPADRNLFETTLAAVLDHLRATRAFPLDDRDRAWILEVLTAFRDSGPDIMYVYQGTPEAHPTYPRLMDMVDSDGINWSYLGSPERYHRVRDLQMRNLIIPVVGDFAGPKALRSIGEYLREHGADVDVFYASNVESYLFTSGVAGAFYENVLAMPVGDTALFVRTFFGSAARECAELRPRMRTPVLSPISEILGAHLDGQITTQCALVGRSR